MQARWVNGKYYPATVKVIDNLCMEFTNVVKVVKVVTIRFTLLGDKATVLFQDNVEHVVLLKDIRAQKVCFASKHIA